jgi:hypothetical protein
LVNPVFDVNHPGEAGGLEPTARRFLDTRPSIVSTKVLARPRSAG